MLDVGIFTHFSHRMSKKHNAPFQSCRSFEFGLRICERSAGASTTVVMTVFRFCDMFGKEEAVVGNKRSRLDRVKYFKATFWK